MQALHSFSLASGGLLMSFSGSPGMKNASPSSYHLAFPGVFSSAVIPSLSLV